MKKILVVTLLFAAALTTGRSQGLKLAEEQINLKWTQVKDIAGEPRDLCLVRVGAGYYRQYVNGRVYYRPGSKAFLVYGPTGAHYALPFSGPESWLGWPTSDEQPFTEDGRVTTFEHGSIYWWPDTGGAFEMADIIVRYKGLYCFGETDDGALSLSVSDEPYVYFGVVPHAIISNGNPKVETSVSRTQVYKGIDGGESSLDNIELYRGLPYGLSLSATLFEKDFGDPNKYRDMVKAGADEAAKTIIAGSAGIPYVGPFMAVALAAAWEEIGEDIIDGINKLLDTEDDYIDTKSLVITAKQMVTLAGRRTENFKGIELHLQTPFLTGDGGQYKVYFDILKVAPPPAPAYKPKNPFLSNDFNHDGNGDILWYNASTGESQIWLMCGSSRIGRATIVEGDRPALIGLPWKIVGSNDFNQNGGADILWYNESTGETQIWFMNSNKFTGKATVLGENGKAALIGLPFRIVGTNDFNQDGKADILWYNESTGETQIWFMNGHKLNGRATVLGENGKAALIGLPFRIVGTNDFNRDGKADILWYNESTGESQIWYMNGHKFISKATVTGQNGSSALVGLPFRIVGTNDFDQDGAADILWHNGSTGETQIWFMKGGSVVDRATVDATRDGSGSHVGLPWSIMNH